MVILTLQQLTNSEKSRIWLSRCKASTHGLALLAMTWRVWSNLMTAQTLKWSVKKTKGSGLSFTFRKRANLVLMLMGLKFLILLDIPCRSCVSRPKPIFVATRHSKCLWNTPKRSLRCSKALTLSDKKSQKTSTDRKPLNFRLIYKRWMFRSMTHTTRFIKVKTRSTLRVSHILRLSLGLVHFIQTS